MKRRTFITLLGGAAMWPIAARAQQPERMRRIGLLMASADDREGQARVTPLKEGLQELGWTDGRNIQIETRFGGADTGRIRAHAAELLALAPDVLVGHATPGTRALRQATSSIPIVMVAVNDPVEQGFVSSLAHPGGNITGFAFVDFQMVGKWLEMLKEAAPGVSRAALMFNPDMSFHYYVYLRSFEAEPRSIAVEVAEAPVRNTAEIEEAIAKLGRDPGGGLGADRHRHAGKADIVLKRDAAAGELAARLALDRGLHVPGAMRVFLRRRSIALTARIFHRRQFIRRRVECGIGIGQWRDDLFDGIEIGVARIHAELLRYLTQIGDGRFLEHDRSLPLFLRSNVQ